MKILHKHHHPTQNTHTYIHTYTPSCLHNPLTHICTHTHTCTQNSYVNIAGVSQFGLDSSIFEINKQ